MFDNNYDEARLQPTRPEMEAEGHNARAADRDLQAVDRDVLQAADRDLQAVKRDVEAVLFAAGAPLSLEVIAQTLSLDGSEGLALLEEIIESLSAEFASEGDRGFELVPLAGGWAFRTNPRCRAAVDALFELPEDGGRLSPAAMETLAIVAYLQPVSRPQIAEVRGVNSDSPVHTLLERELITEVGRSQTAGGAVLYGTTSRFEIMVGLAGLSDLPDLEGFSLSEPQKDDLRRRLGMLSMPE